MLRQTQNEVDEVLGIMKENVGKVLERDQKIENLENSSEALRDGASRFETSAKRLKRKMWWKNMKFMAMLAIVVIAIIVVIVIVSLPAQQTTTAAPTTTSSQP